MRVSDCGSDVCSSYLFFGGRCGKGNLEVRRIARDGDRQAFQFVRGELPDAGRSLGAGRQAAVGRYAGNGDSQRFGTVEIGKRRRDVESRSGGGRVAVNGVATAEAMDNVVARSEEHTSELQSLMRISYAVFCLKKQNKVYTHTRKHTAQN